MVADKFSIGGKEKKEGKFSLKTFQYKERAMLYAFSDGIYHQIGGPKGSKLQKSNFIDFLKSIQETSVDEQERLLHIHHNAWKGKTEQTDDIIVVGIQV